MDDDRTSAPAKPPFDPRPASQEGAEELEATLAAALEEEHPPLPGEKLFEFYDRLRERVLQVVEERSGKAGEAAVEALLLVPDVFLLLVRLTLDSEVPAGARALIGGALAYFVLPLDLLPEVFLGAPGYLEDLVLAAAVLAQAFEGELQPFAKRHWTGSHELSLALERILDGADDVLGEGLLTRLKGLLHRRGVSIPPRDR